MKYLYETNTEAVEIEVDEQWVNVLIDLDRQEYNVNHKETRRHCSLDLYNRDGYEIPSNNLTVLQEVLLTNEIENLYKALRKLNPRQRRLVEQHYLCDVSQTELAEQEGITPQAVHQSIDRALKKLKKILD